MENAEKGPVSADILREASIPATHTRSSSSNPMLGVVGVIRRNDRLLVIQRSEFVRAPLAWCFPGGEIEEGESQEIALIREMREELNADVLPGKLLTTQTKHGGRLILYFWSATLVNGEPNANPKEVACIEWLTPDELRSKEGILPGTADVLTQLGL
ncbi:MAG: NUDIX domain-containing protein [Planctomycetes bacterium]|nr:NUDIX domain-containing protein [Planctomycetota bacterium]